MDAADDLRLLLASRNALIVASTDDEQRLMSILRGAARSAGYPAWTWSVTRGLARDGLDPQAGTVDARRALDFVGLLPDPGVFVFADAHAVLGDPAVVRRLKEVAQGAKLGQTVVLTGPKAIVPPELEGLAIVWRLEPPTKDELSSVVRRTVDDIAARGLPVTLGADGVDVLVDAVRGLTLPEAERLVLRTALRNGRLGPGDIEAVREGRAELLEASDVLELLAPDEGGLDEVGGLENLKEWLRVRRRAFEPAAEGFGLEPPRGLLLTGVPGCGKSLVAKTLARTWGLPLVLLDPGRLYGAYVGESESNLEDALATVEALAPVVLWVDEIEKGFASGTAAGDAGVSQRVLGTFLRWMQERPPGVFLVATSNDVERLPPEFLRRGRFDAIFFVDLPDESERAGIFRVQLSRRRRDPSSFDLVRLARASEGFSGAEIEGAVVGALYRAYADGQDLTSDGIVAELEGSTPLARTRAEDVSRIRAWAIGRATPASNR